MAKRGYKLQEFVAHSANVNCLSIGKKACRLLITGGDDHKVNLWSIGKPDSLMSLCGHASPVESVAFDSAEVLVVAGASTGMIKLWDLEETKMVRSFTGHRSYCTAVEFHPFGEFFASGSMDTNLKIWDIRKKGCIHTYKGHTRGISNIRFTPDGRWVVSGGLDNSIKVWDLTAGKLLHDFKFHEGHIRSIAFHPLEFLLATGSADKTVKFWDLETFEMIGSTRPEGTGVRAITFHPDGRTLFCGLDDSLKVFSWEPVICHDAVNMGWSTLGDLCVHDGKLLGCSYYENSVGVWAADVSCIEPYGAGLVPEKNVSSDSNFNTHGSHSLEKEGGGLRSALGLRCMSPDYETKEIKNIYVDSENPVSSQKDKPMYTPEVVPPLVSKDVSNMPMQKQGSATSMQPKPNGPILSKSFILPTSILSNAVSYKAAGEYPVSSQKDKPMSTPEVAPQLVSKEVSSVPTQKRSSAMSMQPEANGPVLSKSFILPTSVLSDAVSCKAAGENPVSSQKDKPTSILEVVPPLVSKEVSSMPTQKQGSATGMQQKADGQVLSISLIVPRFVLSNAVSCETAGENPVTLQKDKPMNTPGVVPPLVSKPVSNVSMQKKGSAAGMQQKANGQVLSKSSSVPSFVLSNAGENPVSSQKDKPMNNPEVVPPLVSKQVSKVSTKKRGSAIGINPKANGQVLSKSFIAPSFVPRESPERKDSATSRRESIIAARSNAGMLFKPTHTRRQSNSKIEIEKLSVSIDSGLSTRTVTGLEGAAESNFPTRLTMENESRESNEEKHSNPSVAENFERTLSPCTPSNQEKCNESLSDSKESSVKIVNGVAVVSGRTRSLVERFEKREKVISNEEPAINMPLQVVPEIDNIPTTMKEELKVAERESTSGNYQNFTEDLLQTHDVFLSTLRSRMTKLQVVRHFWERNDIKGAINALKKLPDYSVQADVISVLIEKMDILTLDLFSCLLPVLVGLLDSMIERHTNISLEMLLKLVAVFGPVIQSTVSAPRVVGVDLHAEQRFDCCNQCHIQLQNIQKILPTLIRRGGLVAKCALELNLVIQVS